MFDHTAVVADSLVKAEMLGVISGGMDQPSHVRMMVRGLLPMLGLLLVTVMMMKGKWMKMNHWKWTTGAMMM